MTARRPRKAPPGATRARATLSGARYHHQKVTAAVQELNAQVLDATRYGLQVEVNAYPATTKERSYGDTKVLPPHHLVEARVLIDLESDRFQAEETA